MSGGPASTVPGAAQPSDQPAFAGRHHSDRTEGLRPALPVTAGGGGDLKKDPNDLGVPLELLFLPLQVKLEQIRQAESLEQVKEILEEQVGGAGSSCADPS